LDQKDPAVDIGLSELGRQRLPQCISDNGLCEQTLGAEFTVGFVWRYRAAGGAVSHFLQSREEDVRRTKSELLLEMIKSYGAHVLVCGMNLQVNDENRDRVDAKYTNKQLALESAHISYLKGLSWGLELEILRRCSLCIAMPSGFSEALWIKRRGRGLCMVDAPPHYLLKLLANRMPLFDILHPGEFLFQIRQPHSKVRVLRHLRSKAMLPPTGTSP
jgi:hypothetical protein